MGNWRRLAGVFVAGSLGLAAFGSVGEARPVGRAGASSPTPGGSDKIPLRVGAIDTATGAEPTVTADLRSADTGSKELRIVQFAGPIQPEWIDELSTLGLRSVSYLPPNAYVVFGDAKAVSALADRAASDPLLTYEGPFRPAYRLAPDLEPARARGSGTVDVVVQVVEGDAADIAAAKAFGTSLAGDYAIAGFTNLALRVPAAALTELVKLPGVVNVERRVVPVLQDEAQGQLVAGNVQTVGGKRVPTGPGYLAFLQAHGVPTGQSNHPVVAVVDDGVDNGTTSPLHADFRDLGVAANASRIVANTDCTGGGNGQAIGGHGNINAGIVGGYNNSTGAPHEDASGFNLGLGIDPFARLSNVKVFSDAGPFNINACAGTYLGLAEATLAQGATISSNSWGVDVGGAYTTDSQAYDALTRDASAAAGVQPLFHVFSAGNAGPSANMVGAPGTAKNVLTVGATENVRDQGVLDGCNLSAADNADDMASFSSRGPTDDQRAKPDIVAPGTHVQGPASQAPGYNGTGVCGPKYYPGGGQTLYTWSSGTSHSAPAVSGAAALVSEYYRRVIAPGSAPSPAMLKALLLNTPRALNGLDTGGTLPGTGQGWGGVNLSQLYQPDRYVDDQSTVFTASGQRAYRYLTVANSAKPTRITLAFSDAPGSPLGNSYVNDLDLFVVAGGQLYRGNVFNGSSSTVGGASDPRNNVEQVWLPAGVSGRVTVQVLARNIAGNGVPGGAALDQDFALTAANVDPASSVAAVPYAAPASVAATGPGTNGDNTVSPGEPVAVTAVVGNLGPAATRAGTLTLAVASGPAGVIVGTVPVPSVAANSTKTVSGLKIWVLPTAVCNNSVVSLRLRYSANGQPGNATASVTPTGPFTAIASTNVPRAIPDNGSTESTLTASGPARPRRLRVRVNITHTFDQDLAFTLTGPGGQTAQLANRRGGSGDNYTGTVFDDNAATPISGGTAPFTGTFRPETPLSTFLNRSAAGTWTLRVADVLGEDIGTLNSWGIDVPRSTCAAVPRGIALVDAASVVEGSGGGTKAMSFKVVRTGPAGAPLDVAVRTADGTATQPSDYTARSLVRVHFNAGVTTRTVTVAVRKDGATEPNERLKLVLLSAPASVARVRTTATGVIVNDD